jgi:putative nucleotidyltransferase with HDIG domain
MELKETQLQAERLRNVHDQLTLEVQRAQAALRVERKRAERHKERAKHFAEGLKAIHKALFHGNVCDLILRTCMAVTGATRGVYLTAHGDGFRARAAIDVDGYPQDPPSPFIDALCRKVTESRDTLVANRPEDLPATPPSDRPGERFHNCVAAPVAILKKFGGVVIVADKMSGEFEEDDVEQLVSVGDQAAVAVENQCLQRELQEAYLSVVSVLADALEAKDPYTHGHCEMVARLSRRTAERLALDDRVRGVACFGGLLHDIGKIGISDGVLNKPGKLLPEEWELMQSHVRVGRDLLERVPLLKQLAEVIMHHHERWDGTGYPDGLKGESIPLAARIVCVVDAYCTMISKRSYKESLPVEQAREEVKRFRGTQFDPRVVDAFLDVLDGPDPDDFDGQGIGRCDFYHVLRGAQPRRN